jgi:hypothetical protein
MDPDEKEISTTKFADRLRKSWVPLAAVAGALTSFVSASLRTRPSPAENTKPSGPQRAAASPPLTVLTAEPAEELKRRYSQTAVLGGKGSPHRFQHSLADIAVGAGDAIYSLGDDEIRVFEPGGDFTLSWKVKPGAACLGIQPGRFVYIGRLGRVEIYTPLGEYRGSFEVGSPDHPAAVTAIKVIGNEILVADASAKIIRRYDSKGNPLGVIGDKNKTGSFMLPNGWLDFDEDPSGILWATDTGRHRVTGWLPDGSPAGAFGKFGMQNPSDFVGCCNPVNLAVTPEGNIVTAEKMIARVKVFNPEGTLLAYIGPENFHPKCTHIHLAVDSRGRILAADPLHREIKIFTPSEGK